MKQSHRKYSTREWTVDNVQYTVQYVHNVHLSVDSLACVCWWWCVGLTLSLFARKATVLRVINNKWQISELWFEQKKHRPMLQQDVQKRFLWNVKRCVGIIHYTHTRQGKAILFIWHHSNTRLFIVLYKGKEEKEKCWTKVLKSAVNFKTGWVNLL